jgi:aryl-alcohol dehydrogenase-like predicted oxidoreductase
MIRRTLAATGLQVTALGLGLAALGRPAYITLGRETDLGTNRSVEAMERRCHEVLDAAYAAGIRYVDAARSYGDAERFLASWFDVRGLSPDAMTVGSKWGYRYTGDWRLDPAAHEVKEHSVNALRRQLRESLDILGERLDLYQIHSATLESGVLEDRAVLAELVALAGRGIAVGLTVSGPRQAETIARALDASAEGVNPFRSVQATWNVLEPSAGPALAEAHVRGWGVIVKEALANGRLAGRDSAPRLDPLRRAADEAEAPMDAAAIAAALANPWVDVVLTGAVTVQQLRSNLRALDITLGPGAVHSLGAMATPPERYWSERASLPWA